MDTENLFIIAVKLAMGAIAAVLAIAVWSKTREAVWLFTVLGILSLYVEVIYTILSIAGVSFERFAVQGVPVIPLILSTLAPFFFIIACVIMLVKKSWL